tara:strand:- start:590 stop:808 length:219 start_codon:yes stop_codon:yes gene_type:complete
MENNLDYTDFLKFGWNQLKLEMHGFFKSNNDVYVPHLFEPLNKKKVDVKIAYKGKHILKCTKVDSYLGPINL